jgi:hypothetical protein
LTPDELTPRLAECFRAALRDFLREALGGVTDADVDASWGRFRAERLPGVLAAHPPRPGCEEATVEAWVRALETWALEQALEEAVVNDPEHYGSFCEPGPDDKLRQRWFRRGGVPPADSREPP